MNRQVGILSIDIGASAKSGTQPIGDCVLDYEGRKGSVDEGRMTPHRRHRKRHRRRQPAFPRHASRESIEVVATTDLATVDVDQHAQCRAQVQVRAHHDGRVARESNHAPPRIEVARAESSQFLGKNLFEPA